MNVCVHQKKKKNPIPERINRFKFLVYSDVVLLILLHLSFLFHRSYDMLPQKQLPKKKQIFFKLNIQGRHEVATLKIMYSAEFIEKLYPHLIVLKMN